MQRSGLDDTVLRLSEMEKKKKKKKNNRNVSDRHTQNSTDCSFNYQYCSKTLTGAAFI